jgi:hypothetical protein
VATKNKISIHCLIKKLKFLNLFIMNAQQIVFVFNETGELVVEGASPEIVDLTTEGNSTSVVTTMNTTNDIGDLNVDQNEFEDDQEQYAADEQEDSTDDRQYFEEGDNNPSSSTPEMFYEDRFIYTNRHGVFPGEEGYVEDEEEDC